jgi:hypothetical protein
MMFVVRCGSSAEIVALLGNLEYAHVADPSLCSRKSASLTGTGKDLLFSKLSRDLATVLWTIGHISAIEFSLCLFARG